MPPPRSDSGTASASETPLGPLLALARGVDALNRAVGAFAAWLTVPMVLFAVVSAVASALDKRFGTHLASNAWIDAQWYLFGGVFLLGAPFALARGAHVRVDALYSRFAPRTRHWIDLAGGVLFLLPFCIFAATECFDFAQRSFELREASNDPGGLLRYPIKALLPVAFALLGLQGLAQVVKHAAVLRGASPLDVGLGEALHDEVEHGGEHAR
ncbi:MAG: TRAP transporter small permease subunit [Planctomycetota bacterium]